MKLCLPGDESIHLINTWKKLILFIYIYLVPITFQKTVMPVLKNATVQKDKLNKGIGQRKNKGRTIIEPRLNKLIKMQTTHFCQKGAPQLFLI